MQVRLDLLRSANKPAVSSLVPPERPQYKVLQSKERLRMMLAQAQQVRLQSQAVKTAEASCSHRSNKGKLPLGTVADCRREAFRC